MKSILIRRAIIVSVTAIAAFTAGCASVAVSNNAIEQNTAFALGLEKGMFTISDRVDDGIKSSYAVIDTIRNREHAFFKAKCKGRILFDCVVTYGH